MPIRVKHITPKFSLVIMNSNVSATLGVKPTIYTGASVSPTSPLTQAVASLNVVRRMGNPGYFEIVLYPTKPWNELLNPMDYVEIWLSDPNTGTLVPTMRGFIDTVTREFNIASGTPGDYVIIRGSDWQKLTTYPLYYFEIIPQSTFIVTDIVQKWQQALKGILLNNSINPPSGNTVLTGATSRTVVNARNKGFYSPTQLISAIFDGFYKPIVSAIAGNYPTPLIQPQLNVDSANADPLEQELETFHPVVNIESDTAESGLRTTIWDLFVRYQNRPWRELYFDDFYQDATYGTVQTLVYRVTPWQDINGGFLQPLPSNLNTPFTITSDDIMSYNLTRTDSQVANFFMTKTINNEPLVQVQASTQAPVTSATRLNPISIPSTNTGPIVPSDWRIFGKRLQQWQSVYLDYTNVDQKAEVH